MRDPAASVPVGIGLAAPEIDVERDALDPAGVEAALGEAAWGRRLAPRHRRTVERWFAPAPARDGRRSPGHTARAPRGGEGMVESTHTTGERTLLAPEELAAASTRARALVAALDGIVLGQGALTRLVVSAFLARGHVLLEGLPGLGKTELVKGLARVLGLDFKRLQFTPDLLPGDVTGSPVLEEQAGGRRLVFHPGPVFTNLLLADEINRAGPKTQSALLEAMAERRVTVLGETRELPAPFCVLATQNPIELEGTYPLPEAQLDRFLFKLEVAPLERGTLERILLERRHGRPPEPPALFAADELQGLLAAVDAVFLPRAVAGYVARLVEATHPGAASAPAAVRDGVRFGASPRAAIAIAESARAHALLAGKPHVGFDDVDAVVRPALVHRLVLSGAARLDGLGPADVVAAVLESQRPVEDPERVAVPR